MVNCKTHTVSKSDNGVFASSASGYFTVFCVEVAILMANSGMGAFN